MSGKLGSIRSTKMKNGDRMKPQYKLAVCVKVAQLHLTFCDPMDYNLPGSSVHAILQARILEWGAIPFSRDLPNPGIKPRSPALQVDCLLFEPPGKTKNTGVGSLSFLQWIFLTQELNQGLLHCRRILKRGRWMLAMQIPMFSVMVDSRSLSWALWHPFLPSPAVAVKRLV